MHRRCISAVFCCLLVLCSVTALSASTITFGTAHTDTGNLSDILTSGGPLLGAIYEGLSDVTVNGVTFGHYTGVSGGIASFNNPNIEVLNISATNASSSYPFNAPSNYPSSYQTLLQANASNCCFFTPDASAGITNGGYEILISGLSAGTTYQFQIFAGQWDRIWPIYFSDGINGTGDTSVTINNGTPGTAGQYITGSFVADGYTQAIYANGLTPQQFSQDNEIALFDAIQVRGADAVAPPAPEPATITLFAMGVGGLITRRRRTK